MIAVRGNQERRVAVHHADAPRTEERITNGEVRKAMISAMSFKRSLLLGATWTDISTYVYNSHGSPGAVISYGFWQQEYGGGTALGRKLMLNDKPVEVIVPVAAEPPATLLTIQEPDEMFVPLFDALNCRVWPGIKSAAEGAMTIREAAVACGSLRMELPPPQPTETRAVANSKMPNERENAVRRYILMPPG